MSRVEDILVAMVVMTIYLLMIKLVGSAIAKMWKPMVQANVKVVAGKVEERMAR